MSRPSQRQQSKPESCLTHKSRCLQGVEPHLEVPIRRMSFFKFSQQITDKQQIAQEKRGNLLSRPVNV